jgi:hypothetical protein
MRATPLLFLPLLVPGCFWDDCQASEWEGRLWNDTGDPIDARVELFRNNQLLYDGTARVAPGDYGAFATGEDSVDSFEGPVRARVTVGNETFEATEEHSHCNTRVIIHYADTGIRFTPSTV